MGIQRTFWHFLLARLLRLHGPRGVDIRDEVPLSDERPRMDYLLVRKTPAFDPNDPGQTLRGLWPRLPQVTIVEFKSVGRPYRTANLDRLWGYAHTYYANEHAQLGSRQNLAAVLLVPTRTRALDADVEAMGLLWQSLGGGYWQVTGGLFGLYVVEIDAVAEHEDDDLLRLFGYHKEHTLEARRFWAEQMGSEEAKMAVNELEGYDEVIQKLLGSLSPEQRVVGLSPEQVLNAFAPEQRVAGLAPEQRVAGLAPEQRVAGLAPEQVLKAFAPEQRVAGLSPEQVLLTLPDAILRGLSDEALAMLSDATRAAIRKRLGR